MEALALADALRAIADDRRATLWHAPSAVPDRSLLRGTPDDDTTPALVAMTEGEHLVADYRALGLTLGRHPLALLWPKLERQRVVQADVLARYRNGQLARVWDRERAAAGRAQPTV